MYKLLCSNISKTHKSLTNFTGYYRKVAQKCNRTATTSKKFVADTDPQNMQVDENTEPMECTEETLEIETPSDRKSKSYSSFFTQNVGLAEQQLMSATAGPSRFFHSSASDNKCSTAAFNKHFKNKEAEKYYQLAIEQCMDIRSNQDKAKQQSNWAAQPSKPSFNVKSRFQHIETKNNKENEKPKTLKKIQKEKLITIPELEKIAEMKTAKPKSQFKQTKTRITYPTHIAQYKVGTNGYKLQHAVKQQVIQNEQIKTVYKDPVPEALQSVKTKHETSTEKDKEALYKLRIKAYQRRLQKKCQEVSFEQANNKGMIQQHPTVRRTNTSVRMAFKNRYNKLLQKSGLLYQEPIKVKEKQENPPTQDQMEEFEMKRPSTSKNLPAYGHTDKILRQKETREPQVTEHPIATAKQPKVEATLKYPKRILSEKPENFDIDATCVKDNNSANVTTTYGDYIAESDDKVKYFVETHIQEAKELLGKHKDIQILTKGSLKTSDTTKSTIIKEITSSDGIGEYLRKLKELRDQTAIDKFDIKKTEAPKQEAQKADSKTIKTVKKFDDQLDTTPKKDEPQKLTEEKVNLKSDLFIDNDKGKIKQYPISDKFVAKKDEDSLIRKAVNAVKDTVVRRTRPKTVRSQSVEHMKQEKGSLTRSIPLKKIKSDHITKKVLPKPTMPKIDTPQPMIRPAPVKTVRSENLPKKMKLKPQTSSPNTSQGKYKFTKPKISKEQVSTEGNPFKQIMEQYEVPVKVEFKVSMAEIKRTNRRMRREREKQLKEDVKMQQRKLEEEAMKAVRDRQKKHKYNLEAVNIKNKILESKQQANVDNEVMPGKEEIVLKELEEKACKIADIKEKLEVVVDGVEEQSKDHDLNLEKVDLKEDEEQEELTCSTTETKVVKNLHKAKENVEKTTPIKLEKKESVVPEGNLEKPINQTQYEKAAKDHLEKATERSVDLEAKPLVEEKVSKSQEIPEKYNDEALEEREYIPKQQTEKKETKMEQHHSKDSVKAKHVTLKDNLEKPSVKKQPSQETNTQITKQAQDPVKADIQPLKKPNRLKMRKTKVKAQVLGKRKSLQNAKEIPEKLATTASVGKQKHQQKDAEKVSNKRLRETIKQRMKETMEQKSTPVRKVKDKDILGDTSKKPGIISLTQNTSKEYLEETTETVADQQRYSAESNLEDVKITPKQIERVPSIEKKMQASKKLVEETSNKKIEENHTNTSQEIKEKPVLDANLKTVNIVLKEMAKEKLELKPEKCVENNLKGLNSVSIKEKEVQMLKKDAEKTGEGKEMKEKGKQTMGEISLEKRTIGEAKEKIALEGNIKKPDVQEDATVKEDIKKAQDKSPAKSDLEYSNTGLEKTESTIKEKVAVVNKEAAGKSYSEKKEEKERSLESTNLDKGVKNKYLLEDNLKKTDTRKEEKHLEKLIEKSSAEDNLKDIKVALGVIDSTTSKEKEVKVPKEYKEEKLKESLAERTNNVFEVKGKYMLENNLQKSTNILEEGGKEYLLLQNKNLEKASTTPAEGKKKETREDCAKINFSNVLEEIKRHVPDIFAQKTTGNLSEEQNLKEILTMATTEKQKPESNKFQQKEECPMKLDVKKAFNELENKEQNMERTLEKPKDIRKREFNEYLENVSQHKKSLLKRSAQENTVTTEKENVPKLNELLQQEECPVKLDVKKAFNEPGNKGQKIDGNLEVQLPKEIRKREFNEYLENVSQHKKSLLERSAQETTALSGKVPEEKPCEDKSSKKENFVVNKITNFQQDNLTCPKESEKMNNEYLGTVSLEKISEEKPSETKSPSEEKNKLSKLQQDNLTSCPKEPEKGQINEHLENASQHKKSLLEDNAQANKTNLLGKISEEKQSEDKSPKKENHMVNKLSKFQQDNLTKLKEASTKIVKLVKRIDLMKCALKAEEKCAKCTVPDNQPTIRRDQPPKSKDKQKKEQPKSKKDIVLPSKGRNDPKMRPMCKNTTLEEPRRNIIEEINEVLRKVNQASLSKEEIKKCKSLADLAEEQQATMLKEIEATWNKEHDKAKEEEEEEATDTSKAKNITDYYENMKDVQEKRKLNIDNSTFCLNAIKSREGIKKHKVLQKEGPRLIVKLRYKGQYEKSNLKDKMNISKTADDASKPVRAGNATNKSVSCYTTHHEDDSNAGTSAEPQTPDIIVFKGKTGKGQGVSPFRTAKRARIEDDFLKIDRRVLNVKLTPNEGPWRNQNDLDFSFTKLKRARIEDDCIMYEIKEAKVIPEKTDNKNDDQKNELNTFNERWNSIQDKAFCFQQLKRGKIEDDKQIREMVYETILPNSNSGNNDGNPHSLKNSSSLTTVLNQPGNVGQVPKIEAKFDETEKPTETEVAKNVSGTELGDDKDRLPKKSKTPSTASNKKNNRVEASSSTIPEKEDTKMKSDIENLINVMKNADKELEKVLKVYEVLNLSKPQHRTLMKLEKTKLDMVEATEMRVKLKEKTESTGKKSENCNSTKQDNVGLKEKRLKLNHPVTGKTTKKQDNTGKTEKCFKEYIKSVASKKVENCNSSKQNKAEAKEKCVKPKENPEPVNVKKAKPRDKVKDSKTYTVAGIGRNISKKENKTGKIKETKTEAGHIAQRKPIKETKKEVSDIVKKKPIEETKKEGSDIVQRKTIKEMKKEASDIIQRKTIKETKKEASDIVQGKTINEMKKEASNIVQKTINETKKEASDIVQRKPTTTKAKKRDSITESKLEEKPIKTTEKPHKYLLTAGPQKPIKRQLKGRREEAKNNKTTMAGYTRKQPKRAKICHQNEKDTNQTKQGCKAKETPKECKKNTANKNQLCPETKKPAKLDCGKPEGNTDICSKPTENQNKEPPLDKTDAPQNAGDSRKDYSDRKLSVQLLSSDGKEALGNKIVVTCSNYAPGESPIESNKSEEKMEKQEKPVEIPGKRITKIAAILQGKHVSMSSGTPRDTNTSNKIIKTQAFSKSMVGRPETPPKKRAPKRNNNRIPRKANEMKAEFPILRSDLVEMFIKPKKGMYERNIKTIRTFFINNKVRGSVSSLKRKSSLVIPSTKNSTADHRFILSNRKNEHLLRKNQKHETNLNKNKLRTRKQKNYKNMLKQNAPLPMLSESKSTNCPEDFAEPLASEQEIIKLANNAKESILHTKYMLEKQIDVLKAVALPRSGNSKCDTPKEKADGTKEVVNTDQSEEHRNDDNEILNKGETVPTILEEKLIPVQKAFTTENIKSDSGDCKKGYLEQNQITRREENLPMKLEGEESKQVQEANKTTLNSTEEKTIKFSNNYLDSAYKKVRHILSIVNDENMYLAEKNAKANEEVKKLEQKYGDEKLHEGQLECVTSKEIITDHMNKMHLEKIWTNQNMEVDRKKLETEIGRCSLNWRSGTMDTNTEHSLKRNIYEMAPKKTNEKTVKIQNGKEESKGYIETKTESIEDRSIKGFAKQNEGKTNEKISLKPQYSIGDVCDVRTKPSSRLQALQNNKKSEKFNDVNKNFINMPPVQRPGSNRPVNRTQSSTEPCSSESASDTKENVLKTQKFTSTTEPCLKHFDTNKNPKSEEKNKYTYTSQKIRQSLMRQNENVKMKNGKNDRQTQDTTRLKTWLQLIHKQKTSTETTDDRYKRQQKKEYKYTVQNLKQSLTRKKDDVETNAANRKRTRDESSSSIPEHLKKKQKTGSETNKNNLIYRNKNYTDLQAKKLKKCGNIKENFHKTVSKARITQKKDKVEEAKENRNKNKNPSPISGVRSGYVAPRNSDSDLRLLYEKLMAEEKLKRVFAYYVSHMRYFKTKYAKNDNDDFIVLYSDTGEPINTPKNGNNFRKQSLLSQIKKKALPTVPEESTDTNCQSEEEMKNLEESSNDESKVLIPENVKSDEDIKNTVIASLQFSEKLIQKLSAKMDYNKAYDRRRAPAKAQIEHIFKKQYKEHEKIHRFNKNLLKHLQQRCEKTPQMFHRQQLILSNKVLLDPKFFEMQKMLYKFLLTEMKKPICEGSMDFSLFKKYNPCEGIVYFSKNKKDLSTNPPENKQNVVPKKKITFYVEKAPTNRYKKEKEEVALKPATRSCDRLCLPLKAISQVALKPRVEELTTLNKYHFEKIHIVPRKVFNILDKYKDLKITYINIKRPMSKPGEGFLPAILTMTNKNEANALEKINDPESLKRQILEFRYEILRKLHKEFSALYEKDVNNNIGKFDKVSKYYKTVIANMMNENTEPEDPVTPQSKSMEDLLGPSSKPSFERVTQYYNTIMNKNKEAETWNNAKTLVQKLSEETTEIDKSRNECKGAEQILTKSMKKDTEKKEPEDPEKH